MPRILPPRSWSGRAFGWVSLVRLVPYAVIPPLFDFMKIAPGRMMRRIIHGNLTGFVCQIRQIAIVL